MNYVIYLWSILEILQICDTCTCRNPSGAAQHVCDPSVRCTICLLQCPAAFWACVFAAPRLKARLITRVNSLDRIHTVLMTLHLHTVHTHTHTHLSRCFVSIWVSRCGVCLRLQGITSALNHVAPCLECAQCNHPAIFLTHKLSEGLTQRPTHTTEVWTQCFGGATEAFQADSVRDVRRSSS